MPKYTPQEIKPTKTYVVEPGIYPIEITNCVETISKGEKTSGAEMLRLVCEVKLPDGQKGPEIWEYLVFAPLQNLQKRIDEVLEALGIARIVGEEIDISPEDLIGKTGFAFVDYQMQVNPEDAKFNRIKRWIFGSELEKIKAKGTHAVAKANAYKPEENDDIPF